MKNKKYYIISAILFVAFIIFTYLVTSIDVQSIGQDGSKIGFATLNSKIASNLPYNESYYEISKILGYYALATVFIFGLFGVMQLFIRKGIAKVDKDLYVLFGLYILVLAIYIIFKKFVINYGPVTSPNGLESTYSSIHIMIAISCVGAAIIEFSARLKKKTTRNIVVALCVLDGLGIIVFRILSGTQWITDVFAAVLISTACLMLFLGMFKVVIAKKKEVEK